MGLFRGDLELASIKEITKNTLSALGRKQVSSTPENYFKEFKIQSNNENIRIEEFEYFKELLHTLTKDEKNILDKKIETYNELAEVLAKRISNNELKKLLSTFEEVLTPSIDFSIKDDIDTFINDISDNPREITY